MPRRPVWHHAASRAALAIILAFALLPGGGGVSRYGSLLGLAALQQAPNTAAPGTQAGNPACPGEEVSYNPANGELFTAERGKGAFLNDKPLRVAARKRLSDAIVACALPHFSIAHTKLQHYRSGELELGDQRSEMVSLFLRCGIAIEDHALGTINGAETLVY